MCAVRLELKQKYRKCSISAYSIHNVSLTTHIFEEHVIHCMALLLFSLNVLLYCITST